MTTLKAIISYLAEKARGLAANRCGNFAIIFALALPVLVGFTGVSIDYSRAYGMRDKMQADLDSALLAAVKNIDNSKSETLKTNVRRWFDAQTELSSTGYSLEDIEVDTSGKTIKATATASVATTLMKILEWDTIPIQVSAEVAGPSTSYMEVYFVLDKSPSMMLAATSAGQASLRSKAGCEFACHTNEGGPWTYGGKSYYNVYDLSVAMGVQLRTDVAINAVQNVLDMIDTADAEHVRIKMSFYTLGESLKTALSSTYSTTDARKALTNDEYGLNSATSREYTDFNTSLSSLSSLVGSAGDGSSASSPLKLVLLLTDGVQSARSWVTNNPSGKWVCVEKSSGACIRFNSNFFPDQNKVSPLNPDWCSSIKANGATVAVLYTEYLSIPLDWGYNGTVGDTLKSSGFTSLYGGTVDSGVNASKTTRREYIPYALADCASSTSRFLSAASADEIEDGLASLFEQYLSSVRLVN